MEQEARMRQMTDEASQTENIDRTVKGARTPLETRTLRLKEDAVPLA